MSKATKPKLNVKLLRKIQKHILEEPRRFMMASYVRWGKPGARIPREQRLPDQSHIFPACGTTACIAGWANILSGEPPYRAADPRLAVKRLGIKAEQAVPLFADLAWPDPFRDRYRKAKTPAQRAKIATERIEHLISYGE